MLPAQRFLICVLEAVQLIKQLRTCRPDPQTRFIPKTVRQLVFVQRHSGKRVDLPEVPEQGEPDALT